MKNQGQNSVDRWEGSRDELVAKLEELHLRTIEADAYLSAFEAIYSETAWSSGGSAERRRARNQMACFVDLLRATLDVLLPESQVAVELATKRAS